MEHAEGYAKSMRRTGLLWVVGVTLTAIFSLVFLIVGTTTVHSPDAVPTPTGLTSPSAPVPTAVPGVPTPLATATPLDPSPTPGFPLDKYSVDDPNSIWVVVNKARPLQPLKYEPTDLQGVAGTKLRRQVVQPLQDLLAAAKGDGVNIGVRTGYRSYGQQDYILSQRIKTYGRQRAEQGTARAGFTEHQTGLSLDFSSRSQPACDLRDCFSNTKEYRWLSDHAWEYGFIQRYTVLNQEVSGFKPEGWHFRYVGVELASYLRNSDFGSLEELFGLPGGSEYLQ